MTGDPGATGVIPGGLYSPVLTPARVFPKPLLKKLMPNCFFYLIAAVTHERFSSLNIDIRHDPIVRRIGGI